MSETRYEGELAARSPARLAPLLAVVLLLGALTPWACQRIGLSLEAGAHLDRGADLLGRGDAVRAEGEWRAAAAVAPGNANAHRALGALYLSQGRLADARPALHHLADVAPSEPHALCELAQAELQTGSMEGLEAAAADGARAAALEPECIRAQTVAGNAWLTKGDGIRALRYLRRAASLNRADVALQTHVIQAMLDHQQRDDATRLARELTRRLPAYSQGWVILARCFQLYPPGSAEAASVRPALQRALRLDPANARAHTRMGDLLIQAGEARAGVRHLEAARLLARPDSTLLFQLSRGYQVTGRASIATRIMREFRRLSRLENEAASVEKQLMFDPGSTRLLERLRQLSAELGDGNRAERARRRGGSALR